MNTYTRSYANNHREKVPIELDNERTINSVRENVKLSNKSFVESKRYIVIWDFDTFIW